MNTEIFEEIKMERVRQEEKWGPQNHCPSDWLMILGEEVGEANKAALEYRFSGYHGVLSPRQKLKEYRKELIQVAAVAVAMVESLDRNELKMDGFKRIEVGNTVVSQWEPKV